MSIALQNTTLQSKFEHLVRLVCECYFCKHRILEGRCDFRGAKDELKTCLAFLEEHLSSAHPLYLETKQAYNSYILRLKQM